MLRISRKINEDTTVELAKNNRAPNFILEQGEGDTVQGIVLSGATEINELSVTLQVFLQALMALGES